MKTRFGAHFTMVKQQEKIKITQSGGERVKLVIFER